MRIATTLALIAGLTLAHGGPAAAQLFSEDMTEAERELLRQEVRRYLIEEPEVIMEAIEALEAKREAAEGASDAEAISRNRDQIFSDGYSYVEGASEPDITIVEFIDYRCGFCKRAHPVIEDLMATDDGVKLIMKQFPILGEDSVAAGRMALAALDVEPERFGELSDRLLEFRGNLDERAAYRIAAGVGYDIPTLKARAAKDDIAEKISETYRLAGELGINGTPSFIIGDRVIRGFLPADEFVAIVDEERAALN